MKIMLYVGILWFLLFFTAALSGAGAALETKDVPTPYIKFDGNSVTFAHDIPVCH